LPTPESLGQVDVLDPHLADRQCVHQRVALVAGVEYDLATDIWQAEAVPVTPDTGDYPREHPQRVRVIWGTEAQRVHDRYRARTH